MLRRLEALEVHLDFRGHLTVENQIPHKNIYRTGIHKLDEIQESISGRILESSPFLSMPVQRDFRVTYLFFMNDLKLYVSNEVSLKKMLEEVKEYSDDVRMKMGLSKCTMDDILRDKLEEGHENMVLANKSIIKRLDGKSPIKYLRIQ